MLIGLHFPSGKHTLVRLPEIHVWSALHVYNATEPGDVETYVTSAPVLFTRGLGQSS